MKKGAYSGICSGRGAQHPLGSENPIRIQLSSLVQGGGLAPISP